MALLLMWTTIFAWHSFPFNPKAIAILPDVWWRLGLWVRPPYPRSDSSYRPSFLTSRSYRIGLQYPSPIPETIGCVLLSLMNNGQRSFTRYDTRRGFSPNKWTFTVLKYLKRFLWSCFINKEDLTNFAKMAYKKNTSNDESFNFRKISKPGLSVRGCSTNGKFKCLTAMDIFLFPFCSMFLSLMDVLSPSIPLASSDALFLVRVTREESVPSFLIDPSLAVDLRFSTRASSKMFFWSYNFWAWNVGQCSSSFVLACH